MQPPHVGRGWQPSLRRETGQALVPVLILLLVATMVAWAFVSLINGEQRLSGEAHRSAAAFYLAEAGFEKILWRFARGESNAAQNGAWPPVGYQEALGAGRFVIEEVTEKPSGVLSVTVRGEVGGTMRRIRGTTRIAPKALAFGLFTGEVVLAGDARMYVVPLSGGRKACERLGDLAGFKALWFENHVTLNALSGRKVPLRDGAVTDYALFGLPSPPPRSDQVRAALADLVLMEQAELIFGTRGWQGAELRVLYDALRWEVPEVNVRLLRRDQASMPSVDYDVYRALARTNHANQPINKAVGEQWRDRVLRDKKDSLYTQEQFERILGYLDALRREGKGLSLAGLVYVEGMVNISRELTIEDGALVVRGSVRVMDRARLEVRHGPKARTLPGVIASGDGGMIRVGQEAVLIVDGLLLASVGLEVSRATVDISGAMLTGQGILNDGGLVVVRYHLGVLGTIGLSRTEHVLIRPGGWQELP